MPLIFFYLGTLRDPDLLALDDLVVHFRGNTFAGSTKKTYLTYLKSYMKFCQLFNLPLIPASTTNIARYIAFLSNRLKYSSIANYLTVIKTLHLEANLPDPLNGHYVDSVLKGARRVLGDGCQRKLPITPFILKGIFSTIDVNSSFDLAFWTACLVAFFSFLRKSNLLVPSLTSFELGRVVCRQDVSFECTGASLLVRHTKTIQYKERGLCIPLPRIINSPFCPASTLLLLLKLVPAPFEPCPLFMYTSGHKIIPLTYPTFLSRLKTTLQQLGLNSSQYSGHSFRRGGASFALECGVPSDLIQSQGDWRSDAYKKYLDPSFNNRQQVMSTFAASLASYS